MSLLLRKLAPLVCALALGGCLGGGNGMSNASSPGRDRVLTVYSSLPREGVSAPAAAAVAAGERAALSDAGGRTGPHRVRLVQLDSAEPGRRLWDPGRVDENAKRARDDPTTIAYLGELDSGASAVSVPITNHAGILQVSPADGLTSLTRAAPGDLHGGPERYYPTERRTFLRLVPNDRTQAEQLLALVRRAGARRLALVSGHDIYSRELEEVLAALAPRHDLMVIATEDLEDEPAGLQDLVSRLADRRPDAIVLTGVLGPSTGSFLAAAGAGLPATLVLGSSGLLAGGSGQGFPGARRAAALTPVRPVATYPPSAGRLVRRLPAPTERPEALYGYEAMRLVLDAIRRGGSNRSEVVRAALTPRVRRSVIGAYRVRPGGDVSEESFALYRIEHGELVFKRLVR
jgi:branched-chain amino acid transport system substrate-binding protein